MPDLINGRTAAAVTHLTMLRREPNNIKQHRLYVQLAFTYGLTVPQIVEASGLDVRRVQHLLGGV